MTDDNLAIEPQSRVDEACLTVAMCGLVQVHKIHVDLTPRQIAIKLRVQMQERLAKSLQPSDPHLRWRERMHPEDETRAICFAACLLTHLPDLLRPGDERFEDKGQRHALGAIQPVDDLLRVSGDLLQWPGPIKVLRAGYKPNFRGREFHTLLAKINGYRGRTAQPCHAL
jgi:hypothetical protein